MATTFNQGALVAPTSRLSVAELIDTLQACWTDSQLRVWLSATFAERSRLPEADLSRIEQERAKRQAIVDEHNRKQIIADQIEAEKDFARQDRQEPGHRSLLLRDARRAIDAHKLSASRFGRMAVNDPRLIHELERGRTVRPCLEAKVRAYIDLLDAGGQRHG